MIDSGFMGMVFNNFLHIPEVWVWFFVKIHVLVNCSGISGFMGMMFSKSPRFMRIPLRNFSGFMGGTLMISMAKPRILETQVIPPPRVEIPKSLVPFLERVVP